MRKIGIVTINDNNNYGNRLQNYAAQEVLEKINICPITIKNKPITNKREKIFLKYKLRQLKRMYIDFKELFEINKRNLYFSLFNKNIKTSNKNFSLLDQKYIKEYDYFITGSDQVWNPTFNRLRETDLLEFAKPEQKIAFSASFGISKLPEQYKQKTAKALKTFKAISVREDSGKKIVEELTGRTDVEVLVDPTMLLTPEEWDKVSKKPKQLNFDKYILCYFLGELSEQRKKEIERVAKENDCKIINILDKKNPFYETGPSEFLYLEKNAFLICTDSFHSSVFAILYNRPFIVFDREDSLIKMNSRLDTLLKKFELEDRWYEGEIKKEQLKTDYTKAYEILEKEREKSMKFLKKALDIED